MRMKNNGVRPSHGDAVTIFQTQRHIGNAGGIQLHKYVDTYGTHEYIQPKAACRAVRPSGICFQEAFHKKIYSTIKPLRNLLLVSTMI